MDTPQYIKTLLKPNGSKPQGRKVWSVDLESVWLPFFTASNVTEDTHIPHEALGAPLRLAYQADGAVKFSNSGRPVIRVAKELQDNIKLVRENFVAGLQGFTQAVVTERLDEYRTQVKLSQEAGKPIVKRDKMELDKALIEMASKVAQDAQAQVEAVEQVKPKTKVKELVTA